MSLKKVSCMFAIGMFMILFSVKAASACAHHHLPVANNKHVGKTGEIAFQRIGIQATVSSNTRERRHLASKTVYAKLSKTVIPIRAATVVLQDDDEAVGSCIHSNGCTCRGHRSHTRTCGTQGDCHAHPGLICTWGAWDVM